MSTVSSFAKVYAPNVSVAASQHGYFVARDGTVYAPKMANSFGLVLMYIDPVACEALMPKVGYPNPTHLVDAKYQELVEATGVVVIGCRGGLDKPPLVELPKVVTSDQCYAIASIFRTLALVSSTPVRVVMDVTLLEMLAFAVERSKNC